jgi:hypothetical protein
MNIYIFTLILICLSIVGNAQVKVNQNAANSSINTSSAFMDASSSSIWNASVNQGKGLLFPRVNLVNYTAMSHAGPFNASNNPNYFDGLLIYNIATGIASIGGDSVFPGYYYYKNTTSTANGGHWISFKGLQGIAGELSAAFDDTQVLNHKTWTSYKINTELGKKVDTSALATVAISGNYNDLSNKPVIPLQTSQLTNNSGFISNEVQVLSISNDTVFLTGGSFVKITSSTSTPVTQGTRLGFSSSTTWTCPASVTQITVELWGGAGGGAGSGGVYYNSNPNNPTGIIVSACNGGCFTIYGASGGNGGNGGYNKAILTVIPGNVYTITIGSGGSGGSGGSVNYGVTSQGGNGTNGQTTTFDVLLTAPGGNGGTGSISLINGTTAGINGINGNITNYTYPSVNYGTRNYIPNNYLTPFPNNSSNGGSGGSAINHYQNPTNFYIAVGQNGSNGESGYCVISY